jgi:hypothetical protein
MGIGFHTHDALIAHVAQRFGDEAVVQFAGVRLVATGDIGYVNVTDIGVVVPQELNYVTLFNLSVVNIEKNSAQTDKRYIDGFLS